MASGDLLFILEPRTVCPPNTANYATLDTVDDASTPPIVFDVLDYDGATNEYADWQPIVPAYYDGGGFTIEPQYAMDGTAGTGIELEIRALDLADGSDMDSDLGIDTQTAAVFTDTPSATQFAINIGTTVALTHANAGSPAAGAPMVWRVMRDAVTDANGDDLALYRVVVKET